MRFSKGKQRIVSLKEIAQVMSEKTGCTVMPEDVKVDVEKTTTAIYSAVVRDDEFGIVMGTRCILCVLRKRRTPWEFEVTSERLA